MDQELGIKVKGLWEECTSLDETPRPHLDSIDGLEYTVLVKSKDVPLKRTRNVLYWFFSTSNPEMAHKKRKYLIERYHLPIDGVVVYARGTGGGFAKP